MLDIPNSILFRYFEVYHGFNVPSYKIGQMEMSKYKYEVISLENHASNDIMELHLIFT